MELFLLCPPKKRSQANEVHTLSFNNQVFEKGRSSILCERVAQRRKFFFLLYRKEGRYIFVCSLAAGKEK